MGGLFFLIGDCKLWRGVLQWSQKKIYQAFMTTDTS